MGYKEQVVELESEIAAMKQKIYCAYCGQGYDIDTDAALVSEHIATCEKHPMRAVESELAAARAENEELKKVDDGNYQILLKDNDRLRAEVIAKNSELYKLRSRPDNAGRVERVAAELRRQFPVGSCDVVWWECRARALIAIAEGEAK